MTRILLIILLIFSFSSCKSSKRSKSSSSKIITKKNTKQATAYDAKHSKTYKSKGKSYTSSADYIIDYAKQFEGVRYKWGGTTRAGMDCSGLVYESFKSYNIILPRTSKDMAKRGKKVILKNVHNGDLLFFKTGNRRNSINHVGIIVAIRNNDIEFIHSTTSKGVTISNLNNPYWLKAFHEARRIL